MTFVNNEDDDEFLAVACQALSSSASDVVLDTLGWGDLLHSLGDPETRRAAFAIFRAQGRELANSSALGRLMASPYLRGDRAVVASVARQSRRRGTVHVVVGDVSGLAVLVDRPGDGTSVLDVGSFDLRPIEVPGLLELREVEFDKSGWQPAITEDVASAARERSASLGRLALALEMLGAAEGALELAVDHATHREQFGQPIGRFQAVRHLLAQAVNDIVAVESATSAALALDTRAPARFDQVVKALAGRNTRRACEATLQVLGAVGFTADHRHHHFHSRVLALDSLLGTSADLTHDLGRALREEGVDPLVPALTLLTGVS